MIAIILAAETVLVTLLMVTVATLQTENKYLKKELENKDK